MNRPHEDVIMPVAIGMLAASIAGWLTGAAISSITVGFLASAGTCVATGRTARERRRTRRERLARLQAIGIDPSKDSAWVREAYAVAVKVGLSSEVDSASRFARWLESVGASSFSELTGMGEFDKVFLYFRRSCDIDPGGPGYMECRSVLTKLLDGTRDIGERPNPSSLGPLRALIRAADEMEKVRERWRASSRTVVLRGRAAADPSLTESDREMARGRLTESIAGADRIRAWAASAERVIIVGVANEWMRRLQRLSLEWIREAKNPSGEKPVTWNESLIAQARMLSLWCVRCAEITGRELPTDCRRILARVAGKAQELEQLLMRFIGLSKLNAVVGDETAVVTFEKAEEWLRQVAIDEASNSLNGELSEALDNWVTSRRSRDSWVRDQSAGNAAAIERAMRRIADELT